MGAVWYRFRGELRTRWRSVLALTLLVGVAAGAALAAAAGARRTDTAYDRLVERTQAWDVLINPDNGTESGLDGDAVAKLPGVTEAGRADGLYVIQADSTFSEAYAGVVLASDGNMLYRFARPKIIDGRMPNRHRPHEVLVNTRLAEELRVGVGDTIPVVLFGAVEARRVDSGEMTLEQLFDAAAKRELGERARLRVTAIGVDASDVVVDEGFEEGYTYLTPAFRRHHPDAAVPYYGIVVRLRDGAAGVPAFRRAVEQLPHEGAIAFQTEAVTAAKVERAVQPSVGVLTIFAIVVAMTGMLVVGQALARQSFLDSIDSPALHSLGFTRGQLFGAAMLRALAIALSGAALAVVLAFALSPLTPIGPARVAEPDPGLRFDALVLGVGGVSVFLVVLALAALPAWRYARTRVFEYRDEETTRPSRLARALANSGATLPLSSGARMALEPGRGRTAVPVRTTIVSAVLAIATVTGAVVLAASLDHLVSTPRLFGWNWDVSLDIDSDTVTDAARQQVSGALDRSPGVAAWSEASLGDLEVNGASLPAVGVDLERGRLTPSVVSGRVPRTSREIALGARSLRSLGVGVGDSVTVESPAGSAERLRVVGRVVLPGFGTYPGSDKTALGEGAVVTGSTLDRLGPGFDAHAFLVDLREGADRERVVSSVRAAVTEIDPDDVFVQGVQRPSDIVEYGNVRTAPLVLAGVLAVLAAATVAHALVSAVRRRRRDLALLKTLGFSRAQVSATVAWQATTVGALALLFGVPLGIVSGRIGWRALTDNLGTVSEPVVPVLAVLLVIPAVLLLVNIVAFVPGRIAARLRPAAVLRSE
jgi:hypothetical protein